YGTISNQNIKPQPQMTVTGETVYRKAVFDIKIIPQRKNPFNTNTHNQMVMQLLQSGAFTAQAADSAIIALNAMIMENKDSIIRGLKDLKAQAQMEQMQMMQMQQQMAMQQASIPQEQSIPPDSENVGVVLPQDTGEYHKVGQSTAIYGMLGTTRSERYCLCGCNRVVLCVGVYKQNCPETAIVSDTTITISNITNETKGAMTAIFEGLKAIEHDYPECLKITFTAPCPFSMTLNCTAFKDTRERPRKEKNMFDQNQSAIVRRRRFYRHFRCRSDRTADTAESMESVAETTAEDNADDDGNQRAPITRAVSRISDTGRISLF
ncbi:MAG: hypothetical protein ACLSGI_11340, partial [Butyricicoccaceae bacterium]